MTLVITGTGFVSSLGGEIGTSFDAFCRGESALRPLRTFDRSKYRVTAAYEIADRRDGTPDTPGRASRWLCDAIGQAMAQADLIAPARPGVPRVALIVGTGLAEQRSLELWHTAGTPLTLSDLYFGAATAPLGLTPAITLVNACSAGLFALAVAADLLELGDADAVVAAAADSISESMFGLLDRVSLQPPSEVRPFDTGRLGVILGEGAAAIVLEDTAAARRRGVTPLAALRGVATTCDAYHVTAPHRDGVVRAFREAYGRARIAAGQVDLIMAHGTGTPLNDTTEAAALRDVLGDAAGSPFVTALKSLIGHTSGASGLMSLVVAVQALCSGLVPPTLNHVTPIPEAASFQIVTGLQQHAPIRTAQVEAFGFGGVDAVAIIERPPSARVGQGTAAGPNSGNPPQVSVTGVGLVVPSADPAPDLLDLARRKVSLACLGTPPDFDSQAILGRYGLRYKDRATRMALCAVARALSDAGLVPPTGGGAESASFGVVVSSTLAIADTVCRVVSTIHGGGSGTLSPMDLPNVSGNVVASSIAIWFRLAGHNLTVSTGATAGVDAAYLAASAIRAGRVDKVVVVGVESASEIAARLIQASTSHHDGHPLQPAMFDGAVAVVLEGLPGAQARGARVMALIGEYACHPELGESAGAVLGLDAAGAAAMEPAAAGPGLRGRDGCAAPPLWLVPCQRHPAVVGALAAMPLALAVRAGKADLSAATGEASGALGVLQAAAAGRWLAARSGQRAVISSGGCWGANFASLALRSLA